MDKMVLEYVANVVRNNVVIKIVVELAKYEWVEKYVPVGRMSRACTTMRKCQTRMRTLAKSGQRRVGLHLVDRRPKRCDSIA